MTVQAHMHLCCVFQETISWPECSFGIREFSSDDGEGNKNGKKAISKQQLCTCITPFLYISLPSLHDYDMRLPNFMFCGGRERETFNGFLFSFKVYIEGKFVWTHNASCASLYT